MQLVAGSVDQTVQLLTKGCDDVVNPELLGQKLHRSRQTGTPLNIKLGVDPTAPDLHFGHTVVMEKLRQFQELGHQVVLLIGDMTGRVGDPTDKSAARRQLGQGEVEEFAKTYVAQAGRVLDMDRVSLRFNSDWLGKLRFEDVVELLGKMTLARVLERDDFARRFSEHVPIHLHELLYPLMQGYDSVALQADVEIGGTDQRFNIMTARQIQEAYGVDPEVGLFLPILEGTDGVRKMSKSLGNYVGVMDPPEDMYGKVMSIPDALILRWATLLLGWDPDEVAARLESGPERRNVKAQMAHDLVARFWDEAAAARAESLFVQTFQQHQVPEDAPVVGLPRDPWTVDTLDLVALLDGVGSRSEARRLLQQNAVELDGTRLTVNVQVDVHDDSWVRVGRRRYYRFRLRSGD